MTKNRAIFGLFCIASLLGSGCASDGKNGKTGKAGALGEPGATGEPGQDGVDGAPGAPGAPGADGVNGEPGQPGEPGAPGEPGIAPEGTLSAGCLSPCHGFNGIVEQWKTSRHFATYIANLGGEEVATWTGKTACGNCHAIDGIQQRVAANVLFSGTTGPVDAPHGQIGYKSSINGAFTESVYAGHASVAVVHCSTCHDTSVENDPHVTGEAYTAGSFPLRVPSGLDDQALLERSSAVGVSDGTAAGKYGKGNACIWCHKSRKDVTNYVISPTGNISSSRWGPHEGPHADVFTGKGGYEFAGKTYTGGSHQTLGNGCVGCHMPAVGINQNIGDHSFAPQLASCKTCHATATSFDVLGGQTKTKASLQRLRVALNDASLLSRDGLVPLDAMALADGELSLDVALPKQAVPAAFAGALYNYFVLARGSALGVHNPVYTAQLIYDSLQAVGADLTGLARP